MKFNSLMGLVGIATASVVAASPAQAVILSVGSGNTSIAFDSNPLNSTIGFTPTTVNSLILPPSNSFSSLRFDVTGNTVTLLDGNLQTSGGSTNVSFAASTFPDAPNTSNPFTVGNFTIAANGNSLSAIDNLSQGLTLFDLGNLNSTFSGNRLTITGELWVSSEFDNRLYVYSSYDPSYSSKTGTRVGTIQINATTVPEPSTIASVLTVGAIFAIKKYCDRILN